MESVGRGRLQLRGVASEAHGRVFTRSIRVHKGILSSQQPRTTQNANSFPPGSSQIDIRPLQASLPGLSIIFKRIVGVGGEGMAILWEVTHPQRVGMKAVIKALLQVMRGAGRSDELDREKLCMRVSE